LIKLKTLNLDRLNKPGIKDWFQSNTDIFSDNKILPLAFGAITESDSFSGE
jgi:hypothetical protein